MKNTSAIITLTALAFVAAACNQNTAQTAPAAQTAASANDSSAKAQTGLTYASLSELPDWSGAWSDFYTSGTRSQHNFEEIPPLRDQAALAKYMDGLNAFAQGGDNIARAARANGGARGPAAAGGARGQGAGGAPRGGGGAPGAPGGAPQVANTPAASGLCGIRNAGPSNFNGRTANGPGTVFEFLYTPGHVTIASDSGMTRRIFTDGRPVPTDPFTTTMGTSIGHWEGKTLVVETVGLSPDTIITGGVRAGKGFKVSERFYINDKNQMEIDGTITAPEALTAPYNYSQRYIRDEAKDYGFGVYVSDCDHVDRSIDLTTQSQKFDLTPPVDLPPPPK